MIGPEDKCRWCEHPWKSHASQTRQHECLVSDCCCFRFERSYRRDLEGEPKVEGKIRINGREVGEAEMAKWSDKCGRCKHSYVSHRFGEGKCLWMGCGCTGWIEEGKEVGAVVKLCGCGHSGVVHKGGHGKCEVWQCGCLKMGSEAPKKEAKKEEEDLWCACGHPLAEHDYEFVGGVGVDGGCLSCDDCHAFKKGKAPGRVTYKCKCGHRRDKHALRNGLDVECNVKKCACKLYDGPVPDVSKGMWEWGKTSYVHCDHTPYKMLEGKEGGKEWSVWGGTKTPCLGEMNKFDILINCSQNTVYRQHDVPYEWFKKYVHKNVEVNLDWPDRGIPGLPAGFWLEMRDQIARQGARVLCFCIGGHGRTGTAMAALMIASGYGKTEAVELIRAQYCKQAVESKEQMEYLEKLEEDMKPLLAVREAAATAN